MHGTDTQGRGGVKHWPMFNSARKVNVRRKRRRRRGERPQTRTESFKPKLRHGRERERKRGEGGARQREREFSAYFFPEKINGSSTKPAHLCRDA